MSNRWLSLSAAILSALAAGTAVAGVQDGSGPAEEDASPPWLAVLRDTQCDEDYASELRNAGLPAVRITQYSSLADMARFLEIPKSVDAQHLLIAGGYVFVNHVDPARVVEVLSSKPPISGLIGSSQCADAASDAAIHAYAPDVFIRSEKRR
jgi:hypothetical protein